MGIDNDNDDDAEDDEKLGKLTLLPHHDIALDIAAFFADDKHFDNSDDDNRPSDNNHLQHSMIPGGPERPDCSQMSVTEMMFAMEKYQKEQKAYTGCQCRLRLKASEDFVDSSIIYTGCVVNTLRLMVDVAADRLQLGQNFPNKKTVSLRFAEEAIQVSKNMVFGSSDSTSVTAKGVNFLCSTKKTDSRGWVMKELFINVRGKGFTVTERKKKSQKECSPVRVKWLIDLLAEHIRSTPNLSNETMHKFIQGYATGYAITDDLLQKTHSDGKEAIFGNPFILWRKMSLHSRVECC